MRFGKQRILHDLFHKLSNVWLLRRSCAGDVQDLDVVVADKLQHVCGESLAQARMHVKVWFAVPLGEKCGLGRAPT